MIFIKYTDQNHTFLNFLFPKADWSEKYLHQFEDALKAENVVGEIVNPNEAGRFSSTGFLAVAGLSSVEQATKMAELALISMEVPLKDYFMADYGVWKNVDENQQNAS